MKAEKNLAVFVWTVSFSYYALASFTTVINCFYATRCFVVPMGASSHEKLILLLADCFRHTGWILI